MNTVTEDVPSQSKLTFFINRNFALLWTGQSISVLGDFVLDTTLTLWIATSIARGQTWAPLAVSGALIAAAIPMLIFSPIAGVFADRWNKRRTMLYMDALRALLIALLVMLPFLKHLLAVMASFSSSTRLFFAPRSALNSFNRRVSRSSARLWMKRSGRRQAA